MAFTQHASSISCLLLMSLRSSIFYLLISRVVLVSIPHLPIHSSHYYQVMAVTRSNICKNGMHSLSRGGAAIYYASVFLYFWVFSTPVVSLVFGSYLYICINWLHIHFDEAFSSLRIANYKSFTRFHINNEGNLEVYTLAVDKVTDGALFFYGYGVSFLSISNDDRYRVAVDLL